MTKKKWQKKMIDQYGRMPQDPVEDKMCIRDRDIPDKQVLVFGKAAAPGEDNQPQRYAAGREHPDDRVGRGQPGMADAVHQQGERHREEHHSRPRLGHTEDHPDPHPGQGGMPQGVGEKGHAVAVSYTHLNPANCSQATIPPDNNRGH